jgi:hypothetical protein
MAVVAAAEIDHLKAHRVRVDLAVDLAVDKIKQERLQLRIQALVVAVRVRWRPRRWLAVRVVRVL